MEKLVINNFLCIEHAEIEIKKINLFIGPQAQGKSLISKLIYFFKRYPYTLTDAVLHNVHTKEGGEQFALSIFEKIFPKYAWKNTAFTISYCSSRFSITVTHLPSSNETGTNRKLTLALKSDDVFLKPFEKFLDAKKNKQIGQSVAREFTIFLEALLESLGSDYLDHPSYIPAGRSFFATLEKNIFSFIGSEIKIDYFLTLFGENYRNIRQNIQEELYQEINDSKLPTARLKKLTKQIIGGEFVFENNQSWIVSEKNKINIANASSGQQEALPIVLLLLTAPYDRSHPNEASYQHHLIIEEPEAHLFPVSQNDIVLLMANAYNYLRDNKQSGSGINSFTIATHSPYILTAFNNLIQAGNVAASKNYEDLDALREVVPESEWVDFNDVAAYVVNNGTVKSILNQELKLIDANMIDEVSDHLADKFRELLSMEVIDE